MRRNKHEFSLIPDSSAVASVFLSSPHGWLRLVRSEPQLNKRADTNWRLQSEVPEVMMTVPGPIAAVPGPIAAVLAPLWLPVPRSPLLSYSS